MRVLILIVVGSFAYYAARFVLAEVLVYEDTPATLLALGVGVAAAAAFGIWGFLESSRRQAARKRFCAELRRRPSQADSEFQAEFDETDAELAVQVRNRLAEILDVPAETFRAGDNFLEIGDWTVFEAEVIVDLVWALVPACKERAFGFEKQPSTKRNFAVLLSLVRDVMRQHESSEIEDELECSSRGAAAGDDAVHEDAHAESASRITLSTYTRVEEAQRDADRLGRRGIDVSVVLGGTGSVIPGTGTNYELRISPDDLGKLEELREEIENELAAERRYPCPACRSTNYEPRDSVSDGVALIGAVFGPASKRGSLFDTVLRFKCNECGTYYKIDLDEARSAEGAKSDSSIRPG